MSLTKRDRPVAVIAGAGPAGLTSALELLRRSDVQPLVFETDTQVGGISKTVNYRGNRMDLGVTGFSLSRTGSCSGGRKFCQ